MYRVNNCAWLPIEYDWSSINTIDLLQGYNKLYFILFSFADIDKRKVEKKVNEVKTRRFKSFK